MKISVIDSGIAPQIIETNVIFQYDVIKDMQVKCAYDEIGHGTACISLIRQYCPEASFFVYKIYESELLTKSEYLLRALELSIEADVDIINLSLGMLDRSAYLPLKKICDKAQKNNILVIAAGSENNDLLCWPADFPNVIKVISNINCPKSSFITHNSENLTVETYGGRELTKWKDGTGNIVWGTSFACARASGLIAQQIIDSKFRRNGEIKELLLENALNVINSNDVPEKNEQETFNLGKKIVGIFPYNKEMHSLIRFKDILPFEIRKVADFPFSRLVRKDSGLCIGTEESGIIVNSGFKKILDDEIDTVILGDLSEISRLWNKNYLRICSEQAFNAGKDIISIELIPELEYDELKRLAHSYQKNFTALNDYVAHSNHDYAPNISFHTPIVCVLGTGPKVGKFTVQVMLKEVLEKVGYNVEVLCTEPHGFIFGFNTIPLGNWILTKTVHLEDQIDYLRYNAFKIMQEKEIDLLLVGGQSGMIPYDSSVPTDYNSLSSIMMILATKPDGFILCINPNDELSYIKRTIAVIEAFGYGKVMLCIMTSQLTTFIKKNGIQYEEKRQLHQLELDERCKNISSELNIPVYSFKNIENIEKTIVIIQEYFS